MPPTCEPRASDCTRRLLRPAPLSAPPAPLPAPLLATRLPITLREAEVLAELTTGATNDGIAYRLRISRHTVVRQVEHIYEKLGVNTRAAATRATLDALHDRF